MILKIMCIENTFHQGPPVKLCDRKQYVQSVDVGLQSMSLPLQDARPPRGGIKRGVSLEWGVRG